MNTCDIHPLLNRTRQLWLSGLTALGLLLTPATHAADSRAFSTEKTAQTVYTDWMSWIPDSTLLTELSIPATHDTMARYGGGLAETQSLPLLEQLRAGIRCLDIRARHIDDRFAIHHGIVFQKVMFGDVLLDCNAFLERHPSETILLFLSQAGVPEESNVTRKNYETLRWYVYESGLGDKIVRTSSSDRRKYDRRLGSLRGKILLVDDIGCTECGVSNGPVEGNAYYDLNTIFDIPKKWESIVATALKTDAGGTDTLYSNSLDASSENGGVFPIDVARGILGYEGMNSRYLRYLFTGNQRRTTGPMFSDFPGPGLIGGIIAHNLKYSTNLLAAAPDFQRMLGDLIWGTSHEGNDAAGDHAAQVQQFVRHVLPEQHWSVLSSSLLDALNWGQALEPEGLSALAGPVDGYTVRVFNSRRQTPGVTQAQLKTFMTIDRLLPLTGDATQRAIGLKNLLLGEFPNTRWNVSVRKAPFDAGNWALYNDTPVSYTLVSVDEDGIFQYNAWANSQKNSSPVPKVISPAEINEGAIATLDASGSSDPDGDDLVYRWDLDGDGVWDTEYAGASKMTQLFPKSLKALPAVEIFDGLTAVKQTIPMKVRDVRPALTLPPGVFLNEEGRLVRNIPIVDPGLEKWRVRVDFGDGTPQEEFSQSENLLPIDHAYPAGGPYRITVWIEDDDGNSAEASANILPELPKLSIERRPDGSVIISWPTVPVNVALLGMDSLTSGRWVTFHGTVTTAGGRDSMVLPTAGSMLFFRLVTE